MQTKICITMSIQNITHSFKCKRSGATSKIIISKCIIMYIHLEIKIKICPSTSY